MKTLLIACSTAALMAAPAALAEPPQGDLGDDMHADGRHAETYTEDHAWVGLPVHNAEDDRIGSVNWVREEAGDGMTAETDVDTLVIETGGFLGVGDREVEVDASQARLEGEGDEATVILSLDDEDIEALPEVDTSEFGKHDDESMDDAEDGLLDPSQ